MDTTVATLFQPTTATVLAISAGRVGSILASLMALAGIAIGGLALSRSRGERIADLLGGGATSVALGAAALAIGGLVVATSDPELGNGSGRGGAYVAIVLGIVAAAVGGVARARRRPGSRPGVPGSPS